jgi:hypothetical protein
VRPGLRCYNVLWRRGESGIARAVWRGIEKCVGVVVVISEGKERERRYQILRDHGRLTKFAKPDDGISAKNFHEMSFHDLDDVIYQREGGMERRERCDE